MFVRRCKNRNGSYTVMVVDKSSGKYKSALTLGTSKDPLELDRLEAMGREYLRQHEGPELPMIDPGVDDWIEEFVSSSDANKLQLFGPDIVFGSVYDKSGFGSIKSPELKHLVVNRCYGGQSVLSAVDYLKKYTLEDVDYKSLYEFEDNLCHKSKEEDKEPLKYSIERSNIARTVKDNEYYIVADLLQYSDSSEDELSALGKKSTAKVKTPNLCILMLVSSDGTPLGYETCTYAALKGKRIPVLADALVKRYNVPSATVIAGKDILSKAAVETLEKKGRMYLMATGVKLSDLKEGDESVVMAKNADLARRDAELRQAGLDRLQKKIDSGKLTEANVNNKGYNRFLKIEDGIISIDADKVAKEAELDGMQVYSSNTGFSSEKVLACYALAKEVMDALRMSRTDLAARPVLYKSKNRIEGHLCICYIAYAVQKRLLEILQEYNFNIDIVRVRELCSQMFQLDYTVTETGQRRRTLVKMDEDQRRLYDIVNSSCNKRNTLF